MKILSSLFLTGALLLSSSIASAATYNLNAFADSNGVVAERISTAGTGMFSDVFNVILSENSLTSVVFGARSSNIVFSSLEAFTGFDASGTSLANGLVVPSLFGVSGAGISALPFADLSGLPITLPFTLPSISSTLPAGEYSLVLSGNVLNSGASYGVGAVAVVPEPSTIALMLGGLGLVGFMARRRQKA